MQKWGISTAVLGTFTFVILVVLAFMVIERPLPHASEEDSAQLDAQLMAFELELERDRLAFESLRLRAQIQSDLAAVDASLAAAAKQHADVGGEIGAAEEDFEPGFEPGIQPVAYIDDEALGAFENFVPDPVAFEEFYEPLESYGDWYETDDYGPIWQPDPVYVEESWAPYTNGSWGYSDYGWNWESSDPFGWACDHYGRWLYISRHGWVWVPGRQWAPAWVSWRSCDTHIGWAPLPPCATWDRGLGIGGWVDAQCNIGPEHYNFVHRSHFGARHSRSSIVDRSHNSGLVARTKNITRIHQDRNGINNHGPDYEEARERSSQRIQKRKIDIAAGTGRAREKIGPGRVGGKPATPLERLPGVRRETGWGRLGDRGEELSLRRQVVTQARGSLLEQERPAGRSTRGKVLTAITSRPQSRMRSTASMPIKSMAEVNTIQVGSQIAPRKPALVEDPAPIKLESVVEPSERRLPDHFVAERAQREASIASQEALIAERNLLAHERRSRELEARQRIEAQIRERRERQGAVATGGEAQARQGRAGGNASTGSSPSPASSDLAQEASRQSLASDERSRPSATPAPSSRSRSIRRSVPGQPSLASRSAASTSIPAEVQRRSQPAPTSLPSRSITRVDAAPNPRPSVSPPRQQKQERSASPPRPKAAPRQAPSRQAIAPRQQARPQPTSPVQQAPSPSRQPQEKTSRPSVSGNDRGSSKRR